MLVVMAAVGGEVVVVPATKSTLMVVFLASSVVNDALPFLRENKYRKKVAQKATKPIRGGKTKPVQG